MSKMIREIYDAFRAANVSERQSADAAEAVTEGLATKADLLALETNIGAKLESFETDINAKIDRFGTNTNAKITSLKERTESNFVSLEARIDKKLADMETRIIKWMATSLLTQAAVIVTLTVTLIKVL